MTLPALLFGLVVSTLYGAAFHLWQGGGAGRLALYIILSWIGFWIGHLAGSLFRLDFSQRWAGKFWDGDHSGPHFPGRRLLA